IFLAKLRHQTEYRQQVDKWIEKVGLGHAKDQPFGSLSTGQQQRLRLAAALFHNPSILLLDEPGANLDTAGKKLVSAIPKPINDAGQLLILASNDPAELGLCDDVFSIEDGVFVRNPYSTG